MHRLTLAAIVALTTATAANAQTPVERGSYLVNGLLSCGNCHTPRGPGGVLNMARQLSGGPQTFEEANFKVRGANITPDPDTGIGKWSIDDIKRTLRTGVRPNGIPLATVMPYAFYKVFTDRDLEAVAAYLKSIPPVKNAVEPPVYKGAMHPISPPGADRPLSESEFSNPVRHGFYLATIAHCMECHTPTVNDQPDFGNLGKGGREFKGPWGVAYSRNITSHRQKGIGGYSDAEIRRAITQGIRKDGSKLTGPMAFALYATMTEGDLNDLVAYLRTVPAKE